MNEREARMGLAAACAGTADPAMSTLVAQHGPEEVWAGLLRGSDESRWAVRARAIDVADLVVRTDQQGLGFLIPSDQQWPEGLNDLAHCQVSGMGGVPFGLWVSEPARLAELSAGSIAVVGSRAASHYGEWAAGQLACELVRSTPARVIVSGGAYGIDASAHRGALAGQGRTVAVLAGGLDEVYPRGNASLLAAVGQTGALVSEVPPGRSPTRVAFLARNRLIAALTTVTVIVEGAARSGAQNTVAWAHALGRPVAAVPGPISSDRSLTPHRLIRAAEAVLVTSAAEVAELAADHFSPAAVVEWSEVSRAGQTDPLEQLPDELRDVREVLRRGGSSVDEVVGRTGLRPAAVLGRLASLEALGWARMRPDGCWAPGRPRSDRLTSDRLTSDQPQSDQSKSGPTRWGHPA